MRRTLITLTAAILLISCNSETKTENSSDQDQDTTQVQTKNDDQEKSTKKLSAEKNVSAAKDPGISNKTDKVFPHLDTKFIGRSGQLFVKFDASVTEVINKKRQDLDPSHPLYANRGPSSIEELVMKTKLNRNDKHAYKVVFSSGPSADPVYKLYKTGADKPSYNFPGKEMYIPANGNVYTAGHANNVFNTRRKFVIDNGKAKEVDQPFYYVGLQSKTSKPLTIYKSTQEKQPIASIPADYTVEVLINEPGTNNFLVRTDFGLVGWIHLDQVFGQTVIEGLYFAGD
jgi:hypothetical protein